MMVVVVMMMTMMIAVAVVRWCVKLTTHFHPVLKLKKEWTYTSTPSYNF
jgi:hypothetical protein